MKKNKIYLLLPLLLIAFIARAYTPSEKLDFEIEATQVSDELIDVTITILSGEPDFSYAIWKGAPWEGGREIESSGKTPLAEYTFTRVESEAYFVMVTDKKELRRVKQVKLPASE